MASAAVRTFRRPRSRRSSVWLTVAGCVVVVGVLAFVLAGKRDEFATALHTVPVGTLLLAAALQVVALVTRSEGWLVCVRAAGGTVTRRRIYRAAGVGYVGNLVNNQCGTAARIGMLRRSAGDEAPRVPALIAAELPILAMEGALAAFASFTLVGPLGLPWWLPLVALAVAVAITLGLGALAGGRRRGFCSGLAALRCPRSRGRVFALVVVAVFAQIARNWLMLHAVGVDASVFDATAVLIAMALISQLPVGPSVGAAAVVVTLGTNGVALAAAAGVLLTATGTLGALFYAAWAGADRLLVGRRAAAAAVP